MHFRPFRLDELYKMVAHIYSSQSTHRNVNSTFAHFVEVCGMLTIHDRAKKREGGVHDLKWVALVSSVSCSWATNYGTAGRLFPIQLFSFRPTVRAVPFDSGGTAKLRSRCGRRDNTESTW